MKNRIYTLAIIGFMIGTILTGCQWSVEKAETREGNLQLTMNDVETAKGDLDRMENDFISDFQLFKKESNEKINELEKNIADYKVIIANEKNEIKTNDEKILTGLDQQNMDLKVRLEEYKETEKDDCEVFRTKFKTDMYVLENAFKDVLVNNVK